MPGLGLAGGAGATGAALDIPFACAARSANVWLACKPWAAGIRAEGEALRRGLFVLACANVLAEAGGLLRGSSLCVEQSVHMERVLQP